MNWGEKKEYQEMTARMLGQLLTTFDEPEHPPVLAEMASNMIAICAEKRFEVRETKPPQKEHTPRFSKSLNEAYQNQNIVCRKLPNSNDHPAKSSKLKSQRYLQKRFVMKRLRMLKLNMMT
jgi:hypothetical protein